MYKDKPKTILKRYNGFIPIKELDPRPLKFPQCLDECGVSRHILEDRQDRFEAMKIHVGQGSCVCSFLV